MAAVVMVPMISTLLNTYQNAETIFLLDQPEWYNVPQSKMGEVSASLIYYSLPFGILGTLSSGYIYDVFGRRWTLFFSLTILAGLIFALPYTSPSVYPWLLTVKILISLFTAAPISNPLFADYIQKEYIGLGAALIGFGIITGEVLSFGVLFQLTKDIEPKTAFAIAAVSAEIFAIILLFIVKEPQLRKTDAVMNQ